jgi:hypothetical protein
MKKIIFTILFLSIFTSSVYADLAIVLKQIGDDISAMVQDNEEEYVCNGKEVINKEGNVNIEVTCCNCKGKCIEIVIPTNKTGM